VLVNAGFTFPEIFALFQRYAAAGKFAEMYCADPERAGEWLRRSWQQARIFCSHESSSRRSASEALTWATAAAWPGRTGSTDRAIFCAHASLAYKSGQPSYHASARDLAELGGCERKTATKATRRLIRDGHIQLASQSTRILANRYRLGPITQKVSVKTPLPKNKCEGVESTSSFVLPDAFRQCGLRRSAYEVLIALDCRVLTVTGIAEQTGRHVQTVRAALARLLAVGVVKRQGRMWQGPAIGEIDLDALAMAVGAYGSGRRQKEKHQAERLRRNLSVLS